MRGSTSSDRLPSLRTGARALVVTAALLTPGAVAGVAHADTTPSGTPYVHLEKREVCVIVGADNIPKQGMHPRVNTCQLLDPGPIIAPPS